MFGGREKVFKSFFRNILVASHPMENPALIFEALMHRPPYSVMYMTSQIESHGFP